MKICGFTGVFPNEKLIPSFKTFTENVKKDYKSLRRNGLFKNITDETIYVYQIEYVGQKHLGIICGTLINELKNGVIQKHEHTLAAKEQLMIQLLLQRNAMVKPVLLTYPKQKKIDDFIEGVMKSKKPIIDITYDETETHTFWSLTKIQTKKIIDIFNKDVSNTMIADGHHRCSTNLLMHQSSKDKNKYAKLFTAIFSNDQLRILDFNRVINLKTMMDPLNFLARISKYCDIKPIKTGVKPQKTHVMTMYLRQSWYQLKWKKKFIKKNRNTDPALFNELILTKILGIEDVRTDNRIKYLSGEVPLSKMVATSDGYEEGVGFCIYPLNMEYINSVVEKGQTLPPKSSYFVPRLRNGLINMDFEVESNK